MGNTDLETAKRRKKDEFYTSLDDIEKEMVYYRGSVAKFENQTRPL